MHRIDTDTREVDLHGPGKDGFTGGNPLAVIPPTDCTAAWFNDVQENIANAIEAAGLALVKGDGGQLLAALETLTVGRAQGFGEDGGELVYVDSAGTPTPKSRTIFVDAYTAMRDGWDNTGQFSINYSAIGANGGGEIARFPISSWLPDGAEITGLRVRVNPAGASVITASLFSHDGTGSGYPVATTVATATSSSAGDQWIDLGAISSTIDKASALVHHLAVSSGQMSDRLYGYEITFDDPGPRNA